MVYSNTGYLCEMKRLPRLHSLFSPGCQFFGKQSVDIAPEQTLRRLRLCRSSDWDLGVCLQYECKRKQLHKPDVLNSWIDLRSTYQVSGSSHTSVTFHAFITRAYGLLT